MTLSPASRRLWLVGGGGKVGVRTQGQRRGGTGGRSQSCARAGLGGRPHEACSLTPVQARQPQSLGSEGSRGLDRLCGQSEGRRGCSLGPRRPRGGGHAASCPCPSPQRQTSARRSPAETEAPAGSSRGPLSASVPPLSLVPTARQVGAALGVPTCRALTHTHDAPDAQEDLFATSTDAGLLGAGGGDSARGQDSGGTREGPGAHQGCGSPPARPLPPATSPRCPFPSSRCPLLPPPDTPLLPWPTLWVFSRGGRLRLQPLPARRPL